MTTRRTILTMLSVLALAGALGCMGQPILSEAFGLFPGPPLSLLVDATSGGGLAGQLLGSGLDLDALSGLGLDLGGAASADANTPSLIPTTDGSDTQTCPEGEVWVGTVEINGISTAINGCVPEDLASQYGL